MSEEEFAVERGLIAVSGQIVRCDAAPDLSPQCPTLSRVLMVPHLSGGALALFSVGQKTNVDGCDAVGCQDVEATEVSSSRLLCSLKTWWWRQRFSKFSLRAAFEVIAISGRGVEGEIVQLQNLGQVAEVVFADGIGIILHHVGGGGGRAAMIEGAAIVGQDEDQRATRAQDALPLVEGLYGVGEVFQIMRREGRSRSWRRRPE